MFPNQSSAQSGSPGALWWMELDRRTNQKRVVATQWDALMRRFQTRGPALIGRLFLFPRDGNCGAFNPEANIRRTDQVDVDGVFGPESRDLLGYLLCSAGGAESARRLATETNGATPHVSDETVREIILFANHVSAVGTPESPDLSIDINPPDVILPPDLVLPNWLQRVVSLPSDSDWFGVWFEGETPPIPPSMRTAGTPAPAPAPAPTPAPTQQLPATTTTESTTTTTTIQERRENTALLMGAAFVVVVVGAIVLDDMTRTPPRRTTRRLAAPRRSR